MEYREIIIKHLNSIENQCANEFYHISDISADFGEIWECYCDNYLDGYDNEEDIKEYLERINNIDFIDWLTA